MKHVGTYEDGEQKLIALMAYAEAPQKADSNKAFRKKD